jgi:2-oxoisovalerate dehydrogenase E1 component
MQGVRIDGNNILTVYDTLRGVREYCIKYQRPYLVECMTFRMRGHEEASGLKYVPPSLLEDWGRKDPVVNFEGFLREQGVLNDDLVGRIHEEIRQYIESELAAVPEAQPIVPDTGAELRDVYAEELGAVSGELRAEEELQAASFKLQEEIGEVPAGDGLPDGEVLLSDDGLSAGTGSPYERSTFRRKPIREVAKAVGVAVSVPAPVVSLELLPVASPVAAGPVSEKRLLDAVREGLRQSMQQHARLILMGQDIAEYGGAFKITEGFLEEFGKERVRNTPLCESAIVGCTLGLSLEGYKSVMEMQFADFVTSGFTQIVNNLAKIHYRWGQKADTVIRMPTGAGVGAGPFHSQSNEAWFMHTPGLKVVYPATPEDAKGLLIAAINDPNPVLYFEHKMLYRSISGLVPEAYYETPIGKARRVRSGGDIAIITYGAGVHWAVEYAEAHKDISFEILDLRTLLPLDHEAIRAAVGVTGKVLVLHEDTLTGGVGAEVAAWIGEHCFALLDAPVLRCASLDTPVPFNIELERNFLAKSRLDEYVRKLMEY